MELKYQIYLELGGLDDRKYTYSDAVQEAIEISLIDDENVWIFDENESVIAYIEDGKVFEYNQQPNLEGFTFYNTFDLYCYLIGKDKLYRMRDGEELELIATRDLKTPYPLPKRVERIWNEIHGKQKPYS